MPKDTTQPCEATPAPASKSSFFVSRCSVSPNCLTFPFIFPLTRLPARRQGPAKVLCVARLHVAKRSGDLSVDGVSSELCYVDRGGAAGSACLEGVGGGGSSGGGQFWLLCVPRMGRGRGSEGTREAGTGAPCSFTTGLVICRETCMACDRGVHNRIGSGEKTGGQVHIVPSWLGLLAYVLGFLRGLEPEDMGKGN